MPTREHVDTVGARPPVHEVVAAVCGRVPARTAVRVGGDAVTYRELDRWATWIARWLAGAGVGRGDRVCVLAEPSPTAVAAMLGVLRAGAAYAGADASAPRPVLKAALSAPAPRCVVASRVGLRRLTGLGLPPLPTVAAEGPGALRGPAGAVPLPRNAPGDPACVVRPTTPEGSASGGNLLTHARLSAATAAYRALCPGSPVLLLAAPLARDFAVVGLWAALTAGGRLIMTDDHEAPGPDALTRLVERHRVTQLTCPANLFADFLEAAARSGPQRLRTLDTVTVWGGAIPPSLFTRHRRLLGDAVKLVELNDPVPPVPVKPHEHGGPEAPAAVGPDARGRFGRPDAVVHRLVLPSPPHRSEVRA
ncbi:AMP-binding protein [Streptomyces sp. NPDC046759]|uniref:AMP-binding protein n=1 Tax=Streptomyces sp. NPDC046759 TaxID=3155019 RepID=UPI0033F54C38